MAATVPWHHPLFLPTKPYVPHRSSTISTVPRPSLAVVRAFSRSDFEGFVRRVSSGEALRDAWRSVNEGIEQIAFEGRLAAERMDRRYAVSNRIGAAARAAADRAREIDLQLGIRRRWRSFAMDFSRNLPRYRKELSGFLITPIGRGSMMAFFLWFALSGWWFKFIIIATWVLPFAAFLLRMFADRFAIKGACPACRRQFVGYRNQIIRCGGCRNIVWQPKGATDFSTTGNNTSSYISYEADIIDIEIDNK